MKRICWDVIDPAIRARLRLAMLREGSPVRLVGKVGLYTYHGQTDGLAVLRTPEGVELRAGALAVESVEAGR